MTLLKHPNEEALQRFRHSELANDALFELREHLNACALCQERTAALAQDESAALAMLASLDAPAPAVSATRVIERAKRESRSAMWRRAAGIVLVATTAGAAFAMPGSPLRSWIRSVVSRPIPPRAAAPARSVQPTGTTSGIAVTPGERFVIQFALPSVEGEALVTFTDESTISVRAALGSVTFTSEVDRLVIEPHDRTIAVQIAIPRVAPRVEIQVGAERVFLKSGTAITAFGAPRIGEQYRIALKSPTGR